jgi:DHA1 family bicyclomycin/chloramphenicol resistance-like MFS transporter
MAPFTKEAGSASALMGALQMGFGALASALVGIMNNGTTLPLAATMAACALTGLIIQTIGRKKIQYRSRMEDVEEEAFELIEKF